MPYTWTTTEDLTERLESFWLYIDFTIAANKKVKIKDGYCAIFASQQSGPPAFTIPDGGARTFTITDEGGNVLKVDNADFIRCMEAEFSNEFGYLYLYKLDNGVDKTTWVDTSGWKAAQANPTTNGDKTKFWNHTLNFADLDTRYVYWLMDTRNATGTESLTAVMPLLPPSALSAVLSHNKQVMPTLTINSAKPGGKTAAPPAWPYFPQDVRRFPGDVTGYVMIAQGAFKAIPLPKLRSWHVTADNTSPEELFERLAELVHSAPRLKQTLDTAADTKDNSVIPPKASLPLEVLFLNDLNTVNPVAPLIV